MLQHRGSCDCECAPCGTEGGESCTCCKAVSDACNCCNPSLNGCLDSVCPKKVKFINLEQRLNLQKLDKNIGLSL